MRLVKFLSVVFLGCYVSGLVICQDAEAKSVTAIALFDNRAMISVDGQKAKILKAGSSHMGVKLISSNTDKAVVEFDGKRETLELNGTAVLSSELGAYEKDEPAVIELRENRMGFFESVGQINGRSIKFLVDTGANIVVLNSQQARTVGLDYKSGQRTWAATASGRAPMFTTKADTIRVGPIVVNDVEVGVIEGNFPEKPLLGMTFLRKVNMRRNGHVMVLEKP